MQTCKPPNFAPKVSKPATPKSLEYLPDERGLMVRAGVGWDTNTIDKVSLASDLESPAGYAYQTGATVISNHLATETRFRTPQLLADHGVKRAINVLIEKGGESQAFFGVLEVDSADRGQFDEAEADFLAGFADCLALPSSVSMPTRSYRTRA